MGRGDDGGLKPVGVKTGRWPSTKPLDYGFVKGIGVDKVGPRPKPEPWLYTLHEGGEFLPFNHGTSEEAIAYVAIECSMPGNARYHSHAKAAGHRVAIAASGDFIVAHSILFPDGRIWDSTFRTLHKVYEPWKEDEQSKG